jgi:adenylate cyclase
VNKHLGTRLLAAKPICDSQDGVFYRRAGCFLVHGSNEPLELMEIVGLRQAIGADRLRMYRQFELGLDEFQQGGWWRAAEIFQAVLKDYPEDGPSSFFLRKALDYSAEPPDDWRGVVAVEKN